MPTVSGCSDDAFNSNPRTTQTLGGDRRTQSHARLTSAVWPLRVHPSPAGAEVFSAVVRGVGMKRTKGVGEIRLARVFRALRKNHPENAKHGKSVDALLLAGASPESSPVSPPIVEQRGVRPPQVPTALLRRLQLPGRLFRPSTRNARRA